MRICARINVRRQIVHDWLFEARVVCDGDGLVNLLLVDDHLRVRMHVELVYEDGFWPQHLNLLLLVHACHLDVHALEHVRRGHLRVCERRILGLV